MQTLNWWTLQANSTWKQLASRRFCQCLCSTIAVWGELTNAVRKIERIVWSECVRGIVPWSIKSVNYVHQDLLQIIQQTNINALGAQKEPEERNSFYSIKCVHSSASFHPVTSSWCASWVKFIYLSVSAACLPLTKKKKSPKLLSWKSN